MRPAAPHDPVPHRRPAWLGGLLGAALALLPRAATLADGTVVLTGPQVTYREAAEAVVSRLEAAGVSAQLIVLPTGSADEIRAQVTTQLTEADPDVIAAAGVAATTLALSTRPDTPVVSLMVPNLLDAPFAGERSPTDRLVAIAADVDPEERCAWIRRVLPHARRLVVLHSPHTRQTVAALVKAGPAHDLEIVPLEAQHDHFPEAIDTLNETPCDGVVMIPDARVYNAPNVKRLLLWGIRQQRAVIAFSSAVVEAGALAGQYVDSAEVGALAARHVQSLLQGAPPTPAGLHYPKPVHRAVNLRTAEMIGLALEPADLPADTVRFGAEP